MIRPLSRTTKATFPEFFITAEHAGFAVPRTLNNLGCDLDFSAVHFGCDVGVAGIMRELHGFGAETYESNYSRAILDPNRALDSKTLIPAVQDGITLPANTSITPEERQERIRILYDGYYDPLDALINKRAQEHENLFILSVHSMERRLEVDSLGYKTDGAIRPRIALLFRDKEQALAENFATFFQARGIDDIGMNVPYSAKDPDHPFPLFEKYQQRLPMLLLEFRNDLIRDEAGIKTHARLLWDAVQAIILKP
ncbi:MAG: N-formylglutamate amidohydrolase [Alphaproteobacteria bacterium]|nr:N-formylglutamate amidohydrolase [Alphaproteobacteria bacterium]